MQFFGADEVAEIFLLRDQNKALIKLVAELKAENQRLKRRLKTGRESMKRDSTRLHHCARKSSVSS